MKMATPMQMTTRTKIVQPMPMTLPVPTVDSAVETSGGDRGSGAGGDSGPGVSSADDDSESNADDLAYPAPFQRQAPSSNSKA